MREQTAQTGVTQTNTYHPTKKAHNEDELWNKFAVNAHVILEVKIVCQAQKESKNHLKPNKCHDTDFTRSYERVVDWGG
jgi:hypothetical protein